MNNKTHYLSAFYFLGCAVRDTLEYFMPRSEFSIQAFNTKKAIIEQGLREDHPFKAFCDQQKENELGEKIHKQLVDLYNLAYSEEKRTFIHVSGTQIEVDLNQGIKLLDLVIPLKTTLVSVCYSLMNSFNEEEKKEVSDVVDKECEFYCDIAGLILYKYAFLNRFKKFNEEMRAHNGQESVESNFTVSELQKVVGIFGYVKKQTNNRFESFNKISEIYDKALKLTGGQEQLQEGQNMFEILGKYDVEINNLVNPVEQQFHKSHDAFLKEAVAFEKEMQEKMNSQLNDESKNDSLN